MHGIDSKRAKYNNDFKNLHATSLYLNGGFKFFLLIMHGGDFLVVNTGKFKLNLWTSTREVKLDTSES